MFNLLTRSRDALVADFAGLTRDRKYGEGHVEAGRFIVIDTGGITGEEQGIDAAMAEQSALAIAEANIVFFVVDAKAGLTSADELIAKLVRTQGKKTHLIINKIDGMNPDVAAADFYRLGFEHVHFTVASHNRGVRSLAEDVIREAIEEDQSDSESEDAGIKIGIVGRPNVGKSTLVNRLLGEERVVVYDHPGTTRDSIYIPYERMGKRFTLIDTAGIRRRKNVKEAVEKFSIIKTLQAIDDAHVVVLVLDARENIVEQDLHLLGFALDAGKSIVIAVNKWDGMNPESRSEVKAELTRRLHFVPFVNQHLISALHGTGVGNLYKSIEEAYDCSMAKWSTNMLTRILEDAVLEHQPPMVRGHRIKLRYAHQGGSNPPIVVVHGNQTTALPDSYKRYLENTFRKVLKVKGSPIRFEFKTGENPFANKKSKLTPRQQRTQNKRNDVSKPNRLGKAAKKKQAPRQR
ncbi:GTP-binding protein EngA [Oleiphilus messinensis]|uniref:GTPase Der n=2 Tax=Oleiphilus messinensis TaxID=141451 RepID=A0A1Y0I7X0_9GAMM|nr:GTP-binding protein EngA [Oleiphilus messinensis]